MNLQKFGFSIRLHVKDFIKILIASWKKHVIKLALLKIVLLKVNKNLFKTRMFFGPSSEWLILFSKFCYKFLNISPFHMRAATNSFRNF
jgi:hypothetical protein